MKTITRYLILATLACFMSALAHAQDADQTYNAFKTLRDAKNPKPDQSLIDNMSKTGVDFVANYPTDKRAGSVINDMLSYGTTVIDSKNPQLRQTWYLNVRHNMIDKHGDASLKPESKGSLAALDTAMAEGEMMANPSGPNLQQWMEKLDTLDTATGGTGFLLERIRPCYNILIKNPKLQKQSDAILDKYSKSKNRDLSNWAKGEIKLATLRTTPIALSVTTIDGKTFDATKLKGSPALYVIFWTTNMKNAADTMGKLNDVYYEYSRKQIEFLAVCCDPEENREAVTTFIKKNKLKYPVYFDGKGVKSDVCDAFGITRVPPNGYLFNTKGLLWTTDLKSGDIKKYIK